jgi:hypothetical protein
MIIGVFQASSEARKIYENGIEIYYKGVDQEKPKSSLKEAMFGIEDDLNSTEST